LLIAVKVMVIPKLLLVRPSTYKTTYKTILTLVVHDDDSEDESGEDDKLVEEFSAREASTYPSGQQVDLRTNIKLNGIMSEEIVKCISPYPVSNPPSGCRQIDGK
jgi:hypothetical protein